MKQIQLIFFCLLLFTSCSKPTEFCIECNLSTQDDVVFYLYFLDSPPIQLNLTTDNDSKCCQIQDSIWKKVDAIGVAINNSSIDSVKISSFTLKDISCLTSSEILSSIIWQKGINFKESTDHITGTVSEKSALWTISIAAFYIKKYDVIFRPYVVSIFLLSILVLIILNVTNFNSDNSFLITSIALFLACFPLKMEWGNWALGLMCLGVIISFIASKERKFRWQPIYWLPVAIYILYCIGCLYVADFKSGLKEMDEITALVIFPVIFAMMCLTKENVFILLRFFVRTTMAFCLFGLFSYAAIAPEFTWDMVFRDSKLYAPLLLMWPAFTHPSVISIILAMAAPVAIYLRYQAKKISTIEMTLCLLLITTFVTLSGARTGMVIVPAIMGIGLMVYCRIKLIFKWVIVALIALSCLFVLHQHPELKDRFSDPVREQLRATAIDGIMQKPVFGWGTGSMRQIIASEETAQHLGYEVPLEYNHFHNQYLDMAVQFGITGMLLMLGLLAGCLFFAFKSKDFLILSFAVIYGIFMVVESPFATVKGIQPMMFWLCFFITTQKVRLNAQSDHF